jgi:hypothetical protein
MEFQLSQSLSRFFLLHDGILAIKEPFTRTFLFHDGILAIKEPFLHELFFFHDGISAITELFTIFYFSRRNSGYQGAFHTVTFTKCTNWGKTLFIYVTKSIYTGSALIKTLPFDLEPPLQGKEYGPSYSNEIAKRKGNFLFSKSLIDS